MKLLADENVRRDIVAWLRASGHDVSWVAEKSPGILDESILDRARREERIILSADLDFGKLAVRDEIPVPGILLLRIGMLPTTDIAGFFQHHWPQIEPLLSGRIVVLTPHRIRSRPLPS